jgi:hypothetical protein
MAKTEKNQKTKKNDNIKIQDFATLFDSTGKNYFAIIK